MSKPKGVTLQKNDDGTNNPEYVDVLNEDKPISGQKFACISFISPEKILADKNVFFFKQFVNQWDATKSMEKFTQFVNFISFKYNLSFTGVYESSGNFLNYQILTGGKLNF